MITQFLISRKFFNFWQFYIKIVKFMKIHDWAKFLEEAESESELELDEELEDELEDELETEEADLLPFLETGFLTSSFRTFSSANSRFINFMHESWIWVINCRLKSYPIIPPYEYTLNSPLRSNNIWFTIITWAIWGYISCVYLV